MIGLLNSDVLDYYNKCRNITNQQGFPQILMADLQELPIKIGVQKQIDEISELVKNIIEKGIDKDKEKKLNHYVYQLYNITGNEQKEIEQA